MSTPTELIHTFYAAFHQKEAETMARCYHPSVVFSDPAFGELQGDAAGDMWRMLCARAKDLSISHGPITPQGDQLQVRWEAHYTFAQTGRQVHNIIDARFRFKDGLIIEHRDEFDFWRWSRQALGLPGVLLGWTPLLKHKVSATARAGLNQFRTKRQGA